MENECAKRKYIGNVGFCTLKGGLVFKLKYENCSENNLLKILLGKKKINFQRFFIQLYRKPFRYILIH